MKNLKFNTRITGIMILCSIFFSNIVFSQQYINDLSKKDKKRSYRSKTLYIVLHTTEANDESSLASVKKDGTCNYLVMTNGSIHIIITDTKIAKHAGRSMWQHHSNLSEYSVGVEVVGKHNVKPTSKQVIAIKALLYKEKKKYKLSDDKVLTHSMVAYGSPNRWFNCNHRGRKRCGMLFATPSIRKQLGLKNVFRIDPDVKSKRLTIADFFLWKILFGKSISKEKEEPVKTVDQTDDDEKFEGFQEIGKESLSDIAGKEYASSTTIYFFSSGMIRTGKELLKEKFNFKNFPEKTKVLVGYVYGGKISKSRTAYSVVGKKFNSPSTFYVFPDGSIKNGDDIDDENLPLETIVLFRD